MRATLVALVLVAAIVGFGCQVVIADDCKHTGPREATLDAAGAELLVVDVGAGDLQVRGVDDLSEVRATGTACASRQEDLEAIRLTTEQRGGTLYLKAEYPGRTRGQASLDLDLRVPARLALEIEDGSGSIDVSSVASLDLEDGSGSLRIAGIPGEARIDDGSGTIEVQDVGGSLGIEDGSGEIEILGVGGDVEIDDGSGEIELTGVGGSVRLSDGSGSMVVRDVDGGVTVDDDGSGEIDIEGVGGSVLVVDDGSGSIRVRDVEGDLTVRHDGSGSVIVENVRGRVELPED